MKPYSIFFCIVAALTLSACASARKDFPESPDMRRETFRSVNPYYYYTKAQLYKKAGELNNAISSLDKAIKADPDSSYLKTELAMIYYYLNELDKSLEITNAILATNPDNVDALTMLGSIQLRQYDYDNAINTFIKVITIDPKQEQIYLMLGDLYMNSGQQENALNIYSQLVSNYPASYAGYFFLGKIYSAQADLINAEKMFQKSIDLNSELIEPRLELIRIYKQQETPYSVITVKKGDSLNKICTVLYHKYNREIKETILAVNPDLKNADAIQVGQKLRFPEIDKIGNRNLKNKTAPKNTQKIIRVYKDILDIYPNDVNTALGLGLYYHANGMFEDAENLFSALGQRSVSDPGIIAKAAQLLIDEKKYTDAIIAFEGMLKGAPDSSYLHYVAGVAYNESGDNDMTLKHFVKISPESKFYENATVHIAYLYKEQKGAEKAIAYLNEALLKTDQDIEIVLYLSSIYEGLKQFDQAEKIIQDRLRIEPKNTRLLFGLAVIYDKWGKKKAFTEKMKAVIKIDPQDADALNYLGYTMADSGENLDEAERLIKEALKVKPDNGYIIDSLGWVYYKKGRFKEAVEILQKAVALVPDDSVVLEHLGDAYIKVNDRIKALECYKRSLAGKKDSRAELEQKIQELY